MKPMTQKRIDKERKALEERTFKHAYGNPFCSNCNRYEGELIQKDREILDLNQALRNLTGGNLFGTNRPMSGRGFSGDGPPTDTHYPGKDGR